MGPYLMLMFKNIILIEPVFGPGVTVRALSTEDKVGGSNPDLGKVVLSVGIFSFFFLLSPACALSLSQWCVNFHQLRLITVEAKREESKKILAVPSM